MKIRILLLFIIHLRLVVLQDPFKMLGIPALSPSNLDESITNELIINPLKVPSVKYTPELKTIEDLPIFLEKAKLDENEGVKILSKFLIADDYFLKKYGAVFDQTGFDGLLDNEPIAPYGSPMRLVQRAKSAAQIWFKNHYQPGYEPYGAEIDANQGNTNWKVFKVLLIGKETATDHSFVLVCIPLMEDLVALVVNENEECMSKTIFVENAKLKNIPYLLKIKANHFFRKPKINLRKTNQYKNEMIQNNRNSNAPFTNTNLGYIKNLPNKYKFSDYNNNLMQNTGFNPIVSPPDISHSLALGFTNKKLNSLNQISLINSYRKDKIRNITTTIMNNSTMLNSSEDHYDEIKFFQNREKKIKNEKAKNSKDINCLNEKIVEEVFESSKKELLKYLKRRSSQKNINHDINNSVIDVNFFIK